MAKSLKKKLNRMHQTVSDRSLHLLNSKQEISLKLNGFSMYPFLKQGDIGIIQKQPIPSLNIGDIVVFKSEKNWIAHRLIKKGVVNNKFVLTAKGDTSREIDPPFGEVEYIGKLVSFHRKKRVVILSDFLRKSIGFLIAKTSKLNTPFFVINKKIGKRLHHI